METKAQILSKIEQITETICLVNAVAQATPEFAPSYAAGMETLTAERAALNAKLARGEYVGLYGKG